MAARQGRANPPPPPPVTTGRQNEYFVPRDGIDREVITADICRYLGNDALVRPGTYEHPDGHVTQGYYITAYRNLTSAMIQDLKADSARWDQERRAASRSSGSAVGVPSRGSDGYRNSETHHQRQYHGPTNADPSAYGDAMAIDSPPYGNARYPGTGNAGYNGVNSYGSSQRYESSYTPAPAQAQQYSPQPPYDMYGALPTGSSTMASQMFPPQTMQTLSSVQSMQSMQPLQDSPYAQGAAYTSRTAQDQAAAVAAAAAASANRTAAYLGYPDSNAYVSYQTTQPLNLQSTLTQPIDTQFGRGPNQPGGQTTVTTSTDYVQTSRAGTQPSQTGYSQIPPDAQYDATQLPSLKSVASSSTQAQIQSSSIPSPGPNAPRRERDPEPTEQQNPQQQRHRPRDSRDRSDRDDRHAADRHTRRQGNSHR